MFCPFRKLVAQAFCVTTALLTLSLMPARAQSTAFTYEGKLTTSGDPANGTFNMQFKLFDTPTVGSGMQIGATITMPAVQVTNGIFSVVLDFGTGVFVGAVRYLEIDVNAVALSPRQQVLSSPYAIRTLSSASADTATNATKLGGVDAARFVQSDVVGNVSVAGNLSVIGASTFDIANANTQFNLGGQRVLSVGPVQSFFAGVGTGTSNTTGTFDTFFGYFAGQANTTGSSNSFFGASAGYNTSTGGGNAFFGVFAGEANTTGFANSFFGAQAGGDNITGQSNSYFGSLAGFTNQNGSNNSFFGQSAGYATTVGSSSFFGALAGLNNTTGDDNSFFGAYSGQTNTTGGGNAFFGKSAGFANTAGGANAFFGKEAGFSNTTGFSNTFVGLDSGFSNTSGDTNSFFGRDAGLSNTTGALNSFFGRSAGFHNTTGANNAFFGVNAGQNSVAGNDNSFFGTNTGQSFISGQGNTYIGASSGGTLGLGSDNTALGHNAAITGFNVSFATAIGAGSTATTSNTVVIGRPTDTVNIPGTLTKGAGTFKIDHPLDPENKYLYHSFVESPDMMNIYNGNIVTDTNGNAVVMLPDYFEALNKDFRYQLTVLGQFAQAIVAEKINGNRFTIKTNAPNVEVSWQVTGIRHDAYANKHRVQVEEVKPDAERGRLIHPDSFDSRQDRIVKQGNRAAVPPGQQPQ